MAFYIFRNYYSHVHRSFLAKRFLSRENNKHGRKFKSTYFVTTPIFYVNADPHIGHLYTSVIADTIIRFKKLENPDLEAKFMSGTDEHGLKIAQSAENAKLPPLVYCNTISEKFRKLLRIYHVSTTDFLRTTEERHINTVSAFWNKLAENKLIYKDTYCGFYCVSDEAFVSEDELDPKTQPDGSRVTIDNKRVDFIMEETYKFKLHDFKNDLLHWLNSGNVVQPLPFKKLLEGWIHNDAIMQDLSISRPADRVKWGIAVPNDPSQLIYVWLDALTCYLTTNGYPGNNFKWPPDLQVIGKDILKFHGIFWPAFLMGAGLEPPKCILCHSHWVKDGEKMSKSKGNVIDPIDKIEEFACDGFRYYLLRTGSFQYDCNFIDENVIDTLNAELANTLGNLLSRSVGHSVNKKQVFPRFSEENHDRFCKTSSEDIFNLLRTLPEEVIDHYKNLEFYKGITAIMDCLRLGNRFIDVEQPWVLKKDPSKDDHLDAVLHVICELLRVCGILLQPIIPNISNNLLHKLSVPKDERNFSNIRPYSWEKGNSLDVDLAPENTILYKRIKSEKG